MANPPTKPEPVLTSKFITRADLYTSTVLPAKKEMFAMAYTEAQNKIKNEQNAFLLQMEYKKKFVEALEDRLTQMNALRAKIIEESKKSESGILSTAQELSAKKELENIGASQSAAMANARAQNDLEVARIAARGAVDAANATAEYNAEKLSTAQRQQQLSDISKLVPQDMIKEQFDEDLERYKANTDLSKQDELLNNIVDSTKLMILGDKDSSQQEKDVYSSYIAVKLADKENIGATKSIQEELKKLNIDDLNKRIEIADADPNKATYDLSKSLQRLNDLQGSSAKGVNIRSILTADLPEEDRKKFIEIENARAQNSIDKIKDTYVSEVESYDKKIDELKSQIENEYKGLSEKTLPESDTIDLARQIYFDKFGKQSKIKQPKSETEQINIIKDIASGLKDIPNSVDQAYQGTRDLLQEKGLLPTYYPTSEVQQGGAIDAFKKAMYGGMTDLGNNAIGRLLRSLQPELTQPTPIPQPTEMQNFQAPQEDLQSIREEFQRRQEMIDNSPILKTLGSPPISNPQPTEMQNFQAPPMSVPNPIDDSQRRQEMIDNSPILKKLGKQTPVSNFVSPSITPQKTPKVEQPKPNPVIEKAMVLAQQFIKYKPKVERLLTNDPVSRLAAQTYAIDKRNNKSLMDTTQKLIETYKDDPSKQIKAIAIVLYKQNLDKPSKPGAV